MTTEAVRVGVGEITVVIPAYNRATTVARSLRSVLDQTSPVDRIIVVDDGSSDATVVEIEAFGAAVQLIRQANAGAAAARNTGVAQVRTEWVAFLDSDDYWESDHIANMRAAIRATEGMGDFYFADMYWPASGGSLFDLCGFEVDGGQIGAGQIGPAFEMTEDASDWVMMARQPTMMQASVIRTAAYRSIGGMRKELRSRHDTHLFLLLGIGQPACAVAHRGTIMTDDATGGRVTEVIGDRAQPYWWETAVMYRDVLRRAENLPTEYRSELRQRLSSAYLRLARFAVGRCNPLAFAWLSSCAVWQSPKRCLAAIRRRFGQS